MYENSKILERLDSRSYNFTYFSNLKVDIETINLETQEIIGHSEKCLNISNIHGRQMKTEQGS